MQRLGLERLVITHSAEISLWGPEIQDLMVRVMK